MKLYPFLMLSVLLVAFGCGERSSTSPSVTTSPQVLMYRYVFFTSGLTEQYTDHYDQVGSTYNAAMKFTTCDGTSVEVHGVYQIKDTGKEQPCPH
jgi:hypothetical protein